MNYNFKVREIISIHIGQAGIQAGNGCWELFCLEHGIKSDRQSSIRDVECDDKFTTLFAEIQENEYVPRSLFIDLEPTAINEVKRGINGRLFFPEQFISGKEDAANNYARGYYKAGKTIIDESLDKIRKIAENCTGLQGFFIFDSVGGGTGSGFGSLLLEKLSSEYSKKTKFSLAIYPSPKISTSVVEPYNSVLATYKLREFADMSLVLHNEAIYDICNQKLDIERPTYTNINKIIAQVVSGMTVSLRYYDSLNVDLYEFNKNLVPFPKVHFLLSSYAPFLSTVRAYHKDPSVFDITDLAFDSAHMMAKCDPTNGRYIACNLKYMGDVIPKDANAAIIKAREKLRIQSADWWYVGIRCGFCYNAQ